MLNNRRAFSAPEATRGFSLIEMMVSIVIGLIVAAGAVSLIVAIDQSNTETIHSTRLTQELRTLSSLIADDLKRARRITDPIGMVAQGSTIDCPTKTSPALPNQPCYSFTTSQGSAACVTYAYSGTTSYAEVATDPAPARYNYRSIQRVTNPDKTGSIVLYHLAFDPATIASGTVLPTNACGVITDATGASSTAYTLNSSQVDITSLCFSSINDGQTCHYNAANSTCELDATTVHAPAANEIDVCIAGRLVSGDYNEKRNAITRAFVQPVFIRSSSVSGS